MNLPINLSPSAVRDYEDAEAWYERQRPGLGHEFIAQVHDSLERIGRLPQAMAPIFKDFRRMRLDRFPYGIYYRVLETRIEVLAIAHLNRDPKTWQGRG